jgi:uncharacterized protein with HEPN domain
MRSEALYLTDILEATRSLELFLQNVSKEEFILDDMLRSSVVHKLTIIGEAAAHLSPTLRQKYSEIPWDDVVANRNLIVHGYFSISWNIVWETAVQHAIPLQQQIFDILEAEYPDW